MVIPTAPWTKGQLKRLGLCIRDEQSVPPGLPQYDDVMAFYNDVAVDTQVAIQSLDFTSLLDSRVIEVTSRAKTIDTLRQKLQRNRTTPLPNVQDVAGVRFEAEMSLDEQDAVAGAIAAHFGHSAEAIHDLRDDPHSGYRGVHIWLRLPTRVEVQVRTHLQGGWANLYEVAADIFGRDIRYGYIPEDPDEARLVAELHDLSSNTIRRLEMTRNKVDHHRLQWEEMARLGPLPRKARKTYVRTMAEVNATARDVRLLETEVSEHMLKVREDMLSAASRHVADATRRDE